MAYSVSSLTEYVDQQRLPLLVAATFGAKTASLVSKMTGVKSSAALNIMNTDAVFQTQACSWNASGTTTFTQRNLTVGKIAVMEELCPKTLEAYWMQSQIMAGTPDAVPFEEEFTMKKAAVIASQLETAIWQGDTTSGNDNLNKFDGYIKLINAAGTAISATAQADITTSTVRGIMQDIYTKIPAAILDKDDLVVFCGWDVFRMYQIALATANLYHYNGEAGNGEMFIENSGVRLIAVNGLNGTDRIFAGRKSNFFVGVDLEGEEDTFEIFFAREARTVRYVCEFKYGVQVAFPDQIVSYQNS